MQVHRGGDAHQSGPFVIQHRVQVLVPAASPPGSRIGGTLGIGIDQSHQFYFRMGRIPGNVVVDAGSATPHYRGPQAFASVQVGSTISLNRASGHVRS